MDHNAVTPVRLKPAAPQSQVQHSTTEFYLNSVDPDEMQHYAAFHLGFHCLQKYSFRGFRNTKG